MVGTILTNTLWPCQWTSRAYMDLIQDMPFYRDADLFLDYSINRAMLDYTADTSYCNYPDKHKFLIFVTANPTMGEGLSLY
uniref:Uncharacterized protein n=1 Tax=Acrobeloides nanus TaxID=290746 RepID=A0A914DW75_9BILA